MQSQIVPLTAIVFLFNFLQFSEGENVTGTKFYGRAPGPVGNS